MCLIGLFVERGENDKGDVYGTSMVDWLRLERMRRASGDLPRH
jgi:hypothetical protein